MFVTRTAATPHSLMARLTTWCRQKGWRDEVVITRACAEAAMLAVLDGHPVEQEYARRLASPDVQDRVDALNQAAAGIADVVQPSQWRAYLVSLVMGVGGAVPLALCEGEVALCASIVAWAAVIPVHYIMRRLARGRWTLPASR